MKCHLILNITYEQINHHFHLLNWTLSFHPVHKSSYYIIYNFDNALITEFFSFLFFWNIGSNFNGPAILTIQKQKQSFNSKPKDCWTSLLTVSRHLDRPPPKKKTFLQIPQVPKNPLDTFLNSPTTENLNVLDEYPHLKAVFIKLNSALPSSAPVERLFSVGGLTFTPKRSKLSDSNFESLVLLRYNKF